MVDYLPILDRQREILTQLITVARDKQRAFLDGDVEKLEELLGGEEQLLRQLQRTEEERAALWKEDLEESPELEQLLGELKKLLGELGEINGQNQELLATGLSYVQFSLNLLLGGEEKGTYGEKSPQGGSWLDLQV
ncbi:MAG: flagellar protein FlgN [Limnochordia bacterium]|jgi:flagellar biosynthesis/type III secretory pathway chaperone